MLRKSGTSFAETLNGTPSGDGLSKMAGQDRLFGFGGNDRPEGRRGNDVLTGGAAANVFEFGRGITADFQNGMDRLDFDEFSRAQVQAVINSARQAGDDLVLRLSADTIVTIQDVQKAQLDLGDFAF
ncbi:hypothetical protein VB636_18250 [Paracoccus sp. APAP_BH8]|uniref:hypothetical protein n=1 Tax=Paracoccus TaxID=265 RepID=UPI00142E9752|nr:hypothetical protein [Paracoccus pantotrophus]